MRIFKYTGHLDHILKNKCIKVSRAAELNDPFELSPRFDASRFTIEYAIKFLMLPQQIRHWHAREGQNMSLKSYRRRYLKDLRRKAEELIPGVPKNLAEVKRTFANRFDNDWRLFCASTIKE